LVDLTEFEKDVTASSTFDGELPRVERYVSHPSLVFWQLVVGRDEGVPERLKRPHAHGNRYLRYLVSVDLR
jgi:hypothetical protein